MNILMTGNLSALADMLALKFARDEHVVVLAGKDLKVRGGKHKNVSVKDVDPTKKQFLDILTAYRFDVVFYLATREEQLLNLPDDSGGQFLDGLKNVLDLSSTERVKRLFYISSTEIYGEMDECSEQEEPVPASVNGYTLLVGEQYCKLYQEKFGLDILVVRLPFIYGQGEHANLLNSLISECKSGKSVAFPTDENMECSFLHVKDVADFFVRAIHEVQLAESFVVNLSSSNVFTFAELSQMLSEYFPDIKYSFCEGKKLYTRPVIVSLASKFYGWTDVHDFKSELKQCIDFSPALPKMHQKWLGKINQKFFAYAKWFELLIGALLMQFLSEFTSTLIQFKYVDFRLLFVVLMGLVYGVQFGILAAVLASLSVLYTWYSLGYDWALLIYNVGNWFPFAIYFAVGIITGYYRDKKENEIAFEREQKQLIYEKYTFLYGVFEEIRKLKDEFREKLIGYRDSFGKIYTITKELDTLNEQVVFSRALGVIESLMENENIAIYSIDQKKIFARLHVNSYSLNKKLKMSLHLSDYPEAMEKIEHGQIFQNSLLLPDYPAYMAPVMSHQYPFNVPVAMIVIWSARYEQYSTYYFNLLKVISSLVQDSLSRATAFMEMNAENMYLPYTKILNKESFLEFLRIREEMTKTKIASYQILRIHSENITQDDLSVKINSEVRAGDALGVGVDGNCYLLLSQADKTSVKNVMSRLMKHGLVSEVLGDHRFLFGSQEKIFQP